MGVCALNLIFGVCEKGFKVPIGCRHAICKIFEDEGESREQSVICPETWDRKWREEHTCGGALGILSKQRIRGC